MDLSSQLKYQQTQMQCEEIEQNIKMNSPLVSDLLDTIELREEYVSNTAFATKIEKLSSQYSKMRRLRGDGSCFYRAFCYSLMEHLVTKRDIPGAENFKRKCDECRDILKKHNYPTFTVEDFHENMVELIDDFVLKKESTREEIFERFNDQGYSDYYVIFMRLMVSAYIQDHAEDYCGLLGLSSEELHNWCVQNVETTTSEADHIHVAVLSLASGVDTLIVNCQQSGDLNEIIQMGHPDRSTKSEDCPVVLLFRPGHYDVLYRN